MIKQSIILSAASWATSQLEAGLQTRPTFVLATFYDVFPIIDKQSG